MPKLNLYLTDGEAAFVKAGGRGFLRRLVQAAMAGGEEPAVAATPERSDDPAGLAPGTSAAAPPREPRGSSPEEMARRAQALPTTSPRRIVGPTCRLCGGLMLAGKCMVCGKSA